MEGWSFAAEAEGFSPCTGNSSFATYYAPLKVYSAFLAATVFAVSLSIPVCFDYKTLQFVDSPVFSLSIFSGSFWELGIGMGCLGGRTRSE